MSKQILYTDNSNVDDSDNGLYDMVIRFQDWLRRYNNDGWSYVHHTITKDNKGDYLLIAVFSQVAEKV